MKSNNEQRHPAGTAKPVLIIGAGPAGLTAAYELSKSGVTSTILESDTVVGGISRTGEYKGYGFDVGGHRLTQVQGRLHTMTIPSGWSEIIVQRSEISDPRTMFGRPPLG